MTHGRQTVARSITRLTRLVLRLRRSDDLGESMPQPYRAGLTFGEPAFQAWRNPISSKIIILLFCNGPRGLLSVYISPTRKGRDMAFR
jgi:hypothetical protein